MKKLFIFVLLSMPISAVFAVPLSTTCPSGYITVSKTALIITDGTCPSGYISISSPTPSCLVSSPSGACFMYAPANTAFTDTTGTFQFENTICPLS